MGGASGTVSELEAAGGQALREDQPRNQREDQRQDQPPNQREDQPRAGAADRPVSTPMSTPVMALIDRGRRGTVPPVAAETSPTGPPVAPLLASDTAPDTAPAPDTPPAPGTAPDSVTQLPIGTGRGRTVRDVIGATDTDAWLVLHHGRVMVEEYFNDTAASSWHQLLSVSKSLMGTVAGALCDAGVIAVDEALSRYVPALARSGYAGATVRHVLDMRSGIGFSEDYLDPGSDLHRLRSAIGRSAIGRSRPDGQARPANLRELLLGLRRESAHGGPFAYRSCETDVLGWVCEAAAATPLPTLLSEALWSRIGAEWDAVIGVDRSGIGVVDGGISATARDLARFGALYLRDGVSLTGQRVVSPAWVADTVTGGPDSRSAFAASRDDTRMPGGMYRNQFWIPYPGEDVLLCLGIHGQLVYLNRAADVVGVKLSSWPLPQDPGKLFATLDAFDAVSARLAESAPRR